MSKGMVYIIGAGPGDIGLLTLKGLRCLRKADVVVYDFHLNAQILNYINKDAEFIYAGKRGGHHEMSQDEINKALVQKTSEGKIICRLKGGDPFVFGRGGEEAEVLANKGIRFEIIPGISSAIAAPAYAGIPLTHRKYSSSFAVITGNEDATKPESTIDWDGLAMNFDTLVFLMGVKNIPNITQKLLQSGKLPDTPAALVRWGTRPDQKTIVSTLGGIAEAARDAEIKPPAVMIIGNVVKLRDSLQWYEKKPLFGHRILITSEYSVDYEPLEDLGAEIFEFPTITIARPESHEQLDLAIDNIQAYNWIIFTSKNGFSSFLNRMMEKDRDIRDLKGIKICAIGTKTAGIVKSYGIKVDLVPEEFNAEGLISAIVKKCGSAEEHQSGTSEILNFQASRLEGYKILLPRAEVARDIFPQKIRELGGLIDTPAAYRTVKPVRHGKRLQKFLRAGRITIATFSSAATFNNFIEMAGDEAKGFLKDVTIAAIGPITVKAIEKAGLKVHIMPKQATIAKMVEEIIRWTGRQRDSR